MPKSLLKPVHLYCLGIAALGAALFAALLAYTSVGLEHFGTSAFWALAVSVLIGELLPLEIPRISGDGEVTISTMFSFALLLSAGLIPAVAAQAIASAVQDTLARKPLWRIAFNMGQYTLTLAAAAVVMRLIVGHTPPLGSRFGALELVAVLAAAGVFFAVNLVLVTRATSLYEATPLMGSLRSDLFFSLSVGVVLLCLAPIVVTILDFSPVLFPLFFIPLFGIYSSGRQAARTAKAEHEATHDSLTGLPNRRWFREAVNRALADPAAGRAAVMLVDLNRFKDVNDTLGHHHGDLVLREVGPRLRSCFREQDFLARLGGDEFALFMRDISEDGAEAAVERLQAALQAPFEADGISIELDASAGIAWHPDHGNDVDTLLQRADVAMYKAKGTHRPLVTYQPEDDHHSHARLALVADLRRALLEHRLVLHYQPQIDVRRGIPVAVEGLVRWNHPERGLLEPVEFIEVAEQTGVIKDLTYHVINLGLSDLRHWQGAGRDLSLSLNIPGHCLLDRTFAIEVERLLDLHGVSGRSLTFELTESSLLVDPVLAKATMQDLSELGISIAIDDFGTGYSSLAYLTEMPITEMKIDKSFVLGMDSDQRNAVIVKSTIELARNLKLQTVAEGIEDAETLKSMLELGCDLAQGFHLSRGLPAGELLRWCDAHTASLPAPVSTYGRPLTLLSSGSAVASAA
jgi:diguanylate cyclase (GGDEF)-like protein